MTLPREQLIGLFVPYVQAVRGMIDAHPHKDPLSGPPEEHRKLLAWTFLFRSLNLAEAALTSVRAGQAEATGLIARSLLELSFQVNAMNEKPEYADKYESLCSSKHRENVRKCLNWLTKNQSHKQEAIDHYRTFLAEQQSETPCESNVTLFNVADMAKMAEHYRERYSFLCLECHHGTWALSNYIRADGNLLDVVPSYPEEILDLYLSMCMTFLPLTLGILLDWCQIQASSQFTQISQDILATCSNHMKDL